MGRPDSEAWARARALRQSGRTSAALQVLAELEGSDDPATRLWATAHAANIRHATRGPSQRDEARMRALVHEARALGELELEALAAAFLARWLTLQQHPDAAEWVDTALALSQAHPGACSLAWAAATSLALSDGRLADAAAAVRRARSAAVEARDPVRLRAAAVLHAEVIGGADPEAALAVLREARETCTHDSERAGLELREVFFLSRLERHDEAASAIVRVLVGLSDEDTVLLTLAHNAQGNMHRRRGDLASALRSYERSIEAAGRAHPLLEAEARANLVVAHVLRGQHGRAAVDAAEIVHGPHAPTQLADALRLGLLPDAADRGDVEAFDAELALADFGLRRSGLRDPDIGVLARHAALAAERAGWPGRAAAAWALAARGHGPADEALAALRALGASGASLPLGRFRVEEEVARGGSGTVFRARRAVDDGTRWAVKLLRADTDELRASFERELRALCAFRHPNVLQVAAIGRTDAVHEALTAGAVAPGTPWLATPWCAGGALSARVGSLAWVELRGLVGAVLDGLGAAHAAGFLHLDLKPDNLLLDAAGAVTIADFGLARAAGARRRVAGTPPYMAPEVLAGGAAGPPADLYALGCTVWELTVGAPPFLGTVEQIVRQHLGHPPPPWRPASPLPADLEAWLVRLLAKDPRDRFRGCAEARRALDAVRDLPLAAEAAGIAHAPAGSTFSFTEVLDVAGVPRDAEAAREVWARRPPPPDLGPRAPELACPPSVSDDPDLVPLRTPALVGRVAERDRLWRALGAALSDDVLLDVRLDGPEGAGRRRLARWIAAAAERVGAVDEVRVVAVGAAAAEAARVEGRVGLALRLDGAPDAALQLALPPLSERELGALCDDLLPLVPELRARVVAHAQGLPGRAVEALCQLAASEELLRSPHGWTVRTRARLDLST